MPPRKISPIFRYDHEDECISEVREGRRLAYQQVNYYKRMFMLLFIATVLHSTD